MKRTLLLTAAALLLLPCAAAEMPAPVAVPVPDSFSARAKELLADSIPLVPSAHQVNVVYFVPSDMEPYADYERRLSELLLYLQQFYGKEMTRNGYANRSFGLKRRADGMVDIILIRGKEPQSVYADEKERGWEKEAKEVEAYFAAHPGTKASEHTFFLAPVPATADIVHGNPGGWAFHGDGTNCYAIDYPDFELKHIGHEDREGKLLTLWFGGFAHELGHGLNLPHNNGTKPQNEAMGTALLANGNYTFGSKPTYLTKASCDILDCSQTFLPEGTEIKPYAEHPYSEAQNVQLSFDGEALNLKMSVWGAKHINAYVQDPPFVINRDYDAVAFPVTIGDTENEEGYYTAEVRMPLSDLGDLHETGKGKQCVDVLLIREDGTRNRLRMEFDWANVKQGEPIPATSFTLLEGY
ncbi:MAG: hypothetical protein MJ051_02705 [Akkermansia sp.]|nr:hypothetical protein [Akkermansia sp.]